MRAWREVSNCSSSLLSIYLIICVLFFQVYLPSGHLMSASWRRSVLSSVGRVVPSGTIIIRLLEWTSPQVVRTLSQASVLWPLTGLFTTILSIHRIHLRTWSHQLMIVVILLRGFSWLHHYPMNRPMFFSSQLPERTSVEVSTFESRVHHRSVSLRCQQWPADWSKAHVSASEYRAEKERTNEPGILPQSKQVFLCSSKSSSSWWITKSTSLDETV